MTSPLQMDRRELARARKDVGYIADARAALVADSNPLAGLSLLLMITFFAAAYFWAASAVVDEVTRGQGKVTPSSREQVIQSLEGGILAELLVHEGDVVEEGQVLLRIDDTRSGAALREGQETVMAEKAAVARLTAEANGKEPVFPDDVSPSIISLEQKLLNSRRTALWEAVGSHNRNLALAEQELAMTEPLVARGAVSEVEVLRLRRQIIEIKGKIQEITNGFRADAREELARREAELARALEVNTARADEVNRSIVRAPMRGTVKNVEVTTVGGVIRPGANIMEIVPLEDKLLVEARIRPADVAFLRPGQDATVKITAYDYSIYGSLPGHLEHISADTIPDEKNPSETYYRIYVRTESAHMRGVDGPL
ncbi:MAG: HlyD family efflux transporter periplasmic adaptor subunit, partial [Gammaproteobacteria bacterium]